MIFSRCTCGPQSMGYKSYVNASNLSSERSLKPKSVCVIAGQFKFVHGFGFCAWWRDV